MEPWWKVFPERFDYEIEALRSAGYKPVVRSQNVRRGVLEIELSVEIFGSPQKLQGRYSPFFPYTRIEVFAPDLALKRHQHPFSKNLCLIGRASVAWHVDDTLAGLLREQLPNLLAAAGEEGIDAPDGIEEPQGEPVSAYLPYAPESLILIDGEWKVDAGIKCGFLSIGIDADTGGAIRGAVLEVCDESGRVLTRCADAIRSRFEKRIVRGRWVRTDEPIIEQSAREFFRVARSLYARSTMGGAMRPSLEQLEIVASISPEEIEYRKAGDGWSFVASSQIDVKGFRRGRYFVMNYQRTARAGLKDMVVRSPELESLHARTVAIIGLGCVGMPSALEFVRAGVGNIRVMDEDIVEPATTMRWPLGLSVAGKQKATVLKEFVRDNYPYTDVETFVCKFGGVPGLGGTDLEEANRFLHGVDLVYDATAEDGIHYLVSELCRKEKIPYVAAAATHGGWGGRVVRAVPGRTDGCWTCLLHARADGLIPEPPEDPVGEIRPAGCSDPTFTGAGFDLLNVPLFGVRASIGVLAAGQQGGYPDMAFDVAILRLRDEKGQVVAPTWEIRALKRHPKCTNH
ncbi:MAG TPA: ThiF family adenylyltransferase [Candidatus Saccharimonadales bacterium]|jgi:molybdopterin/thiamine biosynthesis adenylyltransferase|nr:ThiF family adenylyltransferase [Candidatus Saccharimonadales bacterium]